MEEDNEQIPRLPDITRRETLYSHSNDNNNDWDGGRQREEQEMMRLAIEQSQREYEEFQQRETMKRQYQQEYQLAFHRLRQHYQDDKVAMHLYGILHKIQQGITVEYSIWDGEVSQEDVMGWIWNHRQSPTFACLRSMLENPNLSFLWE